MSLSALIVYIGIAALALTIILKLSTQQIKVLWLSFFQNFCGALFLFSGWVKVVDPMGTAFKMEQYFAEFEVTFADTYFSFLAPLFPWLSGFSISFSIFMIILEMVLGLLLIFGHWPKLVSWAFFLLVLFFTVLTGFTFLTGYVPSGTNFFNFGEWGPYVETNMRVTDCGCFGDFIKIKPKASFLKDVFLMIPAVLFLFFHNRFHVLWSERPRNMLTLVSTFFLFVYALYNFHWNEPHVDFRPFKEGTNIREQKQLEEEAMANVEISMVIQNNESGLVVVIPQDQYMKEFKNYPREEWTFLDPIKSEPTVAQTKISEWMIEDLDGFEVGDELLEEKGYSLVVVCHKFKGSPNYIEEVLRDTIYQVDTVFVEGDTILVNKVADIIEKSVRSEQWVWKKGYGAYFENKLNALAEAAMRDGHRVYGIVGGASNTSIAQFREDFNVPFDFYKADDILLKTIQRSNPGVYLMRDGVLLKKWHIKRLPLYEEIAQRHIN